MSCNVTLDNKACKFNPLNVAAKFYSTKALNWATSAKLIKLLPNCIWCEIHVYSHVLFEIKIVGQFLFKSRETQALLCCLSNSVQN